MDATAQDQPPVAPITVDALTVRTSDGHRLAGDVATPARPVAVTVLCHPHPDYGGDRFHPVIDELFRALPAAGSAAIRFDFRRPVGGAGLGAAALDVTAALDGAVRRSGGRVPVFLVGYSFGAAAALAAVGDRHDVAGLALIAPPLALLPPPGPAAPSPAIPSLVLVPAHDQFSPPDAVEPVVERWPAAQLETIETADHFLGGRTGWVAERVAGWLSDRVRR